MLIQDKIIERLFSRKIFLIFLIIIIIPFIILCFYALPHSDDFWFKIYYEEYGFFGSFKAWYLNWFGRYTFILIMNIYNILGFEPIIYKLFCIIFQVLFYISLFNFIKILLSEKDKITLHIFSLSVYIIFLYQMPRISEGLYWLAGSVIYFLPISFTLIFYTILINYTENKWVKSKNKKLYYFIVLCVLAFIIIGLSEVAMLFLTFSFFVIMVFKTIKNKKVNFKFLLLFAIIVFSCIIVFMSPGNTIRSASETMLFHKKAHDLLYSLKESVLITSSYLIFEWLRDSIILLFTILYIPYGISQYNKNTVFNKISGIHPLIMIGISIFSISFLFFLGYWNLGGPLPERAVNFIYFIFIILWFINLQFVINFILKKKLCNKNYNEGFSLNLKFIYGIIILIIVLNFSQENNIKYAFSDLFSGNAKKYEIEMNQRKRYILKSKADTCILAPLKNKPHSLFVTDLNHQMHYWPNDVYEKFYNKKVIMLYEK
ncbi:MAG TPA: DUF6056 family protein [Bacteroidales bacterium]|nr:DUF6056 family protein [Bacteroidales bacterium]HPS15953.1 DUF6056 family protein [Bacteroidales bacterium]